MVGEVLPEGVEVYDSPPDYDYAPARRYRYTSSNRHVYVVDPRSRKVARIIDKYNKMAPLRRGLLICDHISIQVQIPKHLDGPRRQEACKTDRNKIMSSHGRSDS